MRRSLVAGLAGALMLLGACSSSSTTDTAVGSTTVPAADFPVTVGDLTLEARPERIISLSPTATEMLFAVGAGSQVVATDEYSNFPAEADPVRTTLSGFEPNVEAIAGYEPDLVIVSYDPGNLVEQLRELDVPVFLAFATTTLEDTYAQILDFGRLTGHAAGAESVVADMRGRIEAAIASVGDADGRSYFYELDPTYYSVTSNTFVGQIFAAFGLVNVADAVADGNDYPQLSAEAILTADPDFVFLADVRCCAQSAETVAARDGWAGLTAVTSGRVIELDDDVASRWGPRVADLVEAIAAALAG